MKGHTHAYNPDYLQRCRFGASGEQTDATTVKRSSERARRGERSALFILAQNVVFRDRTARCVNFGGTRPTPSNKSRVCPPPQAGARIRAHRHEATVAAGVVVRCCCCCCCCCGLDSLFDRNDRDYLIFVRHPICTVTHDALCSLERGSYCNRLTVTRSNP